MRRSTMRDRPGGYVLTNRGKGISLSWEVQDDRTVHVKDSRPTHYPFTALRPINNRTYPLVLKPSDRKSLPSSAWTAVFKERLTTRSRSSERRIGRTAGCCTGPTGQMGTRRARSWRTGRSDRRDKRAYQGSVGCHAGSR